MRTVVIGSGSWGTALGHLLAKIGVPVTLLARNPETVVEIATHHTNERYLPGLSLSPRLFATHDPASALDGAELCVLAVPVQHMASVLHGLAPYIPAHAILVCASKGLEASTLRRMQEVVIAKLPVQSGRYAILSGPSFAQEVVEEKPTAVVLACEDALLGEQLRKLFSLEYFRVYSSTDVIGVELGGAVKNVLAIAAGICDGLNLGHNARAALITRGIAEISRLGEALGAQPLTFMGLSGIGDLVLTCTGNLSRNRQVGLLLVEGKSIDAIISSMHHVAEGVKTTRAVCALAAAKSIDLPIASAVDAVLFGSATPATAIKELMTRALRPE